MSDRVLNALLRSPLTLRLVDLVKLVPNADQSDQLLRFADVLDKKSATPSVALTGSVALQTMHGILEDYVSAYPVCGSMAEVLATFTLSELLPAGLLWSTGQLPGSLSHAWAQRPGPQRQALQHSPPLGRST